MKRISRSSTPSTEGNEQWLAFFFPLLLNIKSTRKEKRKKEEERIGLNLCIYHIPMKKLEDRSYDQMGLWNKDKKTE